MRLVELFPLARASIGDPKATFRRLLGLRLDNRTLLMALAALSMIGTVMAGVIEPLASRYGVEEMFPFGVAPIATALLQFAMLTVLAWLIFRGGRMMGGTASFGDCLLVVVWVQFVMTCLQVFQLVAVLVLPVAAVILGWVGIVLFFWLLTNFIAEAHGFRSRGKVFGSLLMGLLALAVVLVLLMTILGITPPEFSNV